MTRRERISAWLAETHGGLFELTRHFLGESLSSELVSSPEHLQRLAIGVITALGASGLVIPRMYFNKYLYLSNLPSGDLYLMAVRADRLFFLSLSMLIAGTTTILLWPSLFPGRRDFLVLCPLPVRMSHLFLARMLSVLLVVGSVILAANLTLSFAFPLVADGRWQSPSVGLQYFFAHGTASVGAGFFVFFALVAIQGALMNLLPVRQFERASVSVQIVVLLGILVAIPPALSLPNLHREIAARPEWLWYLPPTWFLGLYERLLGSHDPYFDRLAAIALRASAAAGGMSLLTYLASYRRYASRSAVMESGRRVTLRAKLGALLSRFAFPSAAQQAVAGFTSATFQRSRQHKLVLTVYLGIGLAFSVDSASAFLLIHRGVAHRYDRILLMQSVLAMPYIVTLLVVYGLVHVFRIPTEPRANWIFRIGDQRQAHQFLAPVAKLVTLAALLPVLSITPWATAYALGWRAAGLHTGFAAVVALLIAESKISQWDRIPFTCSYLAGRRPIFVTAAFAILVFVFLTTVVTGIESALLKTRTGMPIAIVVLLAGYAWKVRSRLTNWRQTPLVFDDMPEEMFTTLAILPR